MKYTHLHNSKYSLSVVRRFDPVCPPQIVEQLALPGASARESQTMISLPLQRRLPRVVSNYETSEENVPDIRRSSTFFSANDAPRRR